MVRTNGSDDKKGSNEKKMDDIDSLMADTKDTAILSVLAKQKHWYELKNEAIDSLYNALAEAKASKKQAKADGGKTFVVIAKEDSLLQNLRDSAEQEKVSGYDYSPSYPDSITTIEKYEQYQAGLLPEKRDGWLKSIFLKKQISIKKKYRYDSKEFLVVISDKFLHSLPQMLFISLPLFAWVLQLLYMRRKQFYYTDHAVFSIYHFIAVFIIMLVLLFFDKLADLSGWKVFKYLSGACLIFILFYLYKSMRNFYQQTRGKTLLKFVLLCMISGIITSLLTVGFLLLTFFKV